MIGHSIRCVCVCVLWVLRTHMSSQRGRDDENETIHDGSIGMKIQYRQFKRKRNNREKNTIELNRHERINAEEVKEKKQWMKKTRTNNNKQPEMNEKKKQNQNCMLLKCIEAT